MILTLFYTSLFIIIITLVIKGVKASFFDHIVIKKIRKVGDKRCYDFICVVNHYVSKIKIKNFHKLSLRIIDFTKKEIVYLKRKFDSKQPKFFLKPQKNNSGKNSVSFFLKNVSEYRDSLRNKDQSE